MNVSDEGVIAGEGPKLVPEHATSATFKPFPRRSELRAE